MSTIAAGTSAGTALVSSGDTTGQLVLQTNGTTTAVTIGTNQVVTLAQPLPVGSGGTGATSLSGLTTGTATNIAGGSNGTIPYQSASGTTQMLAVGSAGQLLQTNGASAPTWVTPSKGALIWITTVNASSSSTIDIENAFTAYDEYVIKITSLRSDSGSVGFNSRVKLAATGAYDIDANYASTSQFWNFQSGTPTTTGNYGGSSLFITPNVIGSGNRANNFEFRIHKPTSSSSNLDFDWNGSTGGVYTGPVIGAGSNFYSNSSQLTGVRFYLSGGGLMLSGTFRLYGIANS